MKNFKRKIDIAAIVGIALTAIFMSPNAINQMVVFVALMAVVFGRDVLLSKLSKV